MSMGKRAEFETQGMELDGKSKMWPKR